MCLRHISLWASRANPLILGFSKLRGPVPSGPGQRQHGVWFDPKLNLIRAFASFSVNCRLPLSIAPSGNGLSNILLSTISVSTHRDHRAQGRTPLVSLVVSWMPMKGLSDSLQFVQQRCDDQSRAADSRSDITYRQGHREKLLGVVKRIDLETNRRESKSDASVVFNLVAQCTVVINDYRNYSNRMSPSGAIRRQRETR